MKRDAIVITHGMGSQIPFQSIDEIVQGLKRTGVPISSIEARTVQVEGCEPLQRAELRIDSPAGPSELHLYEAYWAPLTEGNVGIWDTVKFLLSGGLNGFVKRGRSFFRVLFGRLTTFEIPVSSTIAVVVAALAVASLLLFNFVAFAVVVKGWWKESGDAQMLQNFMTVIGMVVHTLVAYAALLIAAWMCKASPPAAPAPDANRRRLARIGSALAYPALFGTLAAMIAGACMVLFLLARRFDIALDENWWLAHRRGLTFLAVFFVLAGYFGRSAERFTALMRLIGHLGTTLLAVVVAIELSRPVQHFLDAKVTVAQCLARAGLTTGGLSANEAASLAGLYTRLFKSDINAMQMPWTLLLIGAIVAYLIAAAITYRQQEAATLWSARAAGPSKLGGVANLIAVVFSAIAFPLGVYLLAATGNVLMLRTMHAGGFWHESNKVIFMVPWIGILAAGLLTRGFLISYVGDVAAYVASHKLDRFAEVRAKIKATVEGVFRSVYLMKDNGGQPLYRQVGVVGHSLGSVIAFDALNALQLQEDLKPADALDVKRRTTLLLTFGSPLDKIAYVYSTLSTATDVTRELLTGAAKPLLSDPAARANVAWINIWSPSDIISGSLGFYDGSLPADDRVINVPDPYATTPLAAHTEYFAHDLLFGLLGLWHDL